MYDVHTEQCKWKRKTTFFNFYNYEIDSFLFSLYDKYSKIISKLKTF